MKRFTIIGGLDCVGKSSFTGVLVRKTDDLGLIIDTDKLNAEFDGDRIEGGKKAIKLMEECLEKGLSFTQETTLSGVRTLKTIRRAIELDYHIKLYYIDVNSCEESLLRIANRVRKGGHDIPAEDVHRRYEKRFNDLAAVLPYCSEAEFWDNENGFVNVGEYKNGNLVIYGNEPPEWLLKLKTILIDNE
ncbi:zeta toxin family protein [Ruminococcus flavefaciens]|uniref:zeta toxin family protein n=1 Tax=Ruminococcus flavefaciens TaxID=1265 RepID=UPI00049212B1|nr:zeta toxin family protein [Ruminococcus flavefaciens]